MISEKKTHLYINIYNIPTNSFFFILKKKSNTHTQTDKKFFNHKKLFIFLTQSMGSVRFVTSLAFCLPILLAVCRGVAS